MGVAESRPNSMHELEFLFEVVLDAEEYGGRTRAVGEIRFVRTAQHDFTRDAPGDSSERGTTLRAAMNDPEL